MRKRSKTFTTYYFQKYAGKLPVPEICDHVKSYYIHCKIQLNSATPSGQSVSGCFHLDSWKSNFRQRFNEIRV